MRGSNTLYSFKFISQIHQSVSSVFLSQQISEQYFLSWFSDQILHGNFLCTLVNKQFAKGAFKPLDGCWMMWQTSHHRQLELSCIPARYGQSEMKRGGAFTRQIFTSKTFCKMNTVAISFIFNKYCIIIN